LDLSHLNTHVQFGLSICELGVRLSFVGLSLRFKDSCLCLDLGNFLLGVATFGSLANFTSHTSFGNIDTCLIGGSFMGFARKEGEVF